MPRPPVARHRRDRIARGLCSLGSSRWPPVRATKDGAGGRRSWETGKVLRIGDGEGHEGGGKREKEIKGMTILQKKSPQHWAC
jgi:hypothetical protein